MKKLAALALAPMLIATSVGTAVASNAKESPIKPSSTAFTVSGCDTNSYEDIGGVNFCSPQTQSLYSKHASQKNINFAQKYILLHFTSPTELDKPDGTYWHNYVVIDPVKKEAYPFPFMVRDDDLSKDVKVKVNKSSSQLCIPGRYSIDGSIMSGSFGGNKDYENCFNFYNESDFTGFSMQPAVEKQP